jgi:uracil-DNA glycosylase
MFSCSRRGRVVVSRPVSTAAEQAKRNRLRLWLRGERAFGLTMIAVPRGAMQEISAAPVPVAASEPVMPKRELKPPPPASPTTDEPAPLLIPPPSVPSFDAPLLPREQKIVRLQQMDTGEVKVCTRCRLHATRTNTVFGEGDPDAPIFFIGEGPGENEDLQGRPFVGRAGQLLDRMIAGMGLKREQVYIANIVKCRPPNNRVPGTDEVDTCTPYLERQLEIVRPRVIVTLGRPATTYMLNTKLAMNRLRGQWQTWRGIKLMPTFHPSYVLRTYTEEVRAAVWSDLKKVLVELGMPVPKRG